MTVEHSPEAAISEIAAAIGEPARVRILYNLLDGRARTSTELAVIAEVSPSTTSAHLQRLKEQCLVKVFSQGKHRYYSLHGLEVAAALEAIDVIAGGARAKFVPSTPPNLLGARTCYDHVAGRLGVVLHDRLMELGWLLAEDGNDAYDLTAAGTKALELLGIDVKGARGLRRRFAYACLDWSERRPHLGGALAAALLKAALKWKWMIQDLDSRALSVTRLGKRQLRTTFGLQV
jgi:DNA-binding transcriptional ArsR family regulator